MNEWTLLDIQLFIIILQNIDQNVNKAFVYTMGFI